MRTIFVKATVPVPVKITNGSAEWCPPCMPGMSVQFTTPAEKENALALAHWFEQLADGMRTHARALGATVD